jgi:methionyl-tRNA synthetase
MEAMRALDEKIASSEPFKVVKIDEIKGKEMIKECLISLHSFALHLSFYLPKTSEKILSCIRENKMPEKPLFARLS